MVVGKVLTSSATKTCCANYVGRRARSLNGTCFFIDKPDEVKTVGIMKDYTINNISVSLWGYVIPEDAPWVFNKFLI